MFKIEDNKSFAEMRKHFELAAKEGHQNSSNYAINKMKKRWDNYLTFTLLTYYKKPLAFAGVYKYDEKLVRICGRYYVFPTYRNVNLSFRQRPANSWMIPYQHNYAKQRGLECFFSIQTLKKRKAMIKSVKTVEYLGFKLLDGLYATCNPDNDNCWQNIASTTAKINLPFRNV